MITKSVTEIRKLNEKDSKWTIPQFWKIVELFSKSEQLDFQTVRFNNIFNGNDEPLFAMESLGLVTIIWKDGRPMFLKCGRPLYQSVFQRMMSDTKLKAAMNIITCKFIQKNEQTKLEVYEKEMMDLTRILSGGGSERVVLARSSRNAIEARIDLLTKLFIESQNKFKDAEEVMKKEKELLKK